jgi:hypothetical protein
VGKLIYINKSFDEIDGMNKDGLSILAAEEGILVEKFDKDGIYLTDDYKIINKTKDDQREAELIENHNKMIEIIHKKTGKSKKILFNMLQRKAKNIPHEIIDNRHVYKINKEEAGYISKWINEKSLRFLSHMTLEKAIQFDKKYIAGKYIKAERNKYKVTKVLSKYHSKTLGRRKYYLREDVSKIENELKELKC